MISITANSKLRLLWNLSLSTRAFPYGCFLITLFPFFAILADQGRLGTLWSLVRILPFVFAMAAGFTYNTVCDAKTDPKVKNPISRGDLSEGTATVAVAVYSVIATVLLVITYESWFALGLFIIYLLLWLAYSGLRIRFKESVLATVVASFVLWTGPPLILLSGFEYFTGTMAFLLTGLFAVYVGHEIKHTVVEHDEDKEFGSKTFAVILGRKRSTTIEYVVLLLGYALLLVSLFSSEGGEDGRLVVFFSALFAISIVVTVYYGYRVGYEPRKDTVFVTLPYISTKIYLVVFGLIALGFSALLIFFVVWLFLIRRYP